MGVKKGLRQNVQVHLTKVGRLKLGDKKEWPRSRDLLLNFGTPSVFLKRLKLQTSNLVC